MPSKEDTESALRAIAKIDDLRALHLSHEWPKPLTLEVAFYSMQASAALFLNDPEKANEFLDKALVMVKTHLSTVDA